MKFENLLAEVGGFGPFQIVVISIMFATRFALPCHFLAHNFIAAMPTHHCNISSLDNGSIFENLTQEQKMTISIPVQEDGTSSSCKMFQEPQLHLLYGNSNSTVTPAVQCQNGWIYDTSTFASTIATEWDLICDKRGLTKASATIFFIGVMVGAMLFGLLSDRYGRRSMLLLSYVSTILFGVASAFSPSFVVFVVLRFFTGLSIVGISIISTVLSVEWFDIKHRRIVGVSDSMAWTVGTIMLSWIAYLVNDWRWLLITATSPLTLAIVLWRWLPESARWLIATGQSERAYYYLTKCGRMNGKDEFISKIKPEELSLVVVVEKEKKTYTYLDLVRTPKMRRLSLLTGAIWFGIASTYYGISFNLTGFGLNIYLTQFIYGVIEIPSKLVVYYLLERIGRRSTEVGALLLAGVCLGINLFIPKDKWIYRIVIAVLGKAGSAASFTTIYLYTSELYPTVVRQNAMGYSNVMARVGVSLAPLILLLDEVWGLLPQVVMCVVAMSTALLTCLLPETLNRSLPETIQDITDKGKSPKT